MSTGAPAIQVEKKGDVVILRFRVDSITAGEYLSRAYEELRELARSGCGNLLFSLDNVEFLSSAGIAAFVWLNQQAKESGGRFKLSEVRPDVLEALRIGHIDRALDIYDTDEDALAAFAAEAS